MLAINILTYKEITQKQGFIAVISQVTFLNYYK
jgi:hypothetical protein